MDTGKEVQPSLLPERNLHDSHKEHYASIQPDGQKDGLLSDTSIREHRRPKHNIGLLLLVALVTAIVVGAAVGGGVGSQLSDARQRATKCTTGSGGTTVTSTKTILTSSAAATASNGLLEAYVPAQPADIASLALDCPQKDGESYCTGYWSGFQSQRFSISCQNRYEGSDLGAIVSYTFNDCMEACASMNAYQGRNICQKITFNAVMQDDQGTILPFNCFLKTLNGTIIAHTVGDLSSQNLAASAVYIEDC